MNGKELVDNFNYLTNVSLKRATSNVISDPYTIPTSSPASFPETIVLTATNERLLVYNIITSSLQSYNFADGTSCSVIIRLYNADGTLKFVSNFIGLYTANTLLDTANSFRFAAFNDVNQVFPLLEIGEYITAQVQGPTFNTNPVFDQIQFEFKVLFKYNLPENVYMKYQIIDSTNTSPVIVYTKENNGKQNLISLFDRASRSNDLTVASQDTVPGAISLLAVRLYPEYNVSKNNLFFTDINSIGFSYAGYAGYNSTLLRNQTSNSYSHPHLVPGDSVAVAWNAGAGGTQPSSMVVFAILYEF